MSDPTESAYCACIVTFKRPERLVDVVNGLAAQTLRPTLVTIVDNDPDESARIPVEKMQTEIASMRIDYVALGTNTGPSGGWAAAVDAAERSESRGSWVAIFDDDDPITDPRVMDMLVAAANLHDDGRLGAIGLRGARLSRTRVRLVRARPAPRDIVEVDYLASNGAPLYNWRAVDSLGFFDRELFFGFEDLDLGLRLQRAGWRLCAYGLDDVHKVANTAPSRTLWREYYKSRAMIAICRRHLGPVATLVFVFRSIIGGSVLLTVRQRSLGLLAARFRGAFDGMTGRFGIRRYHPMVNPAKAVGTTEK